jgi:hypothetical protein
VPPAATPTQPAEARRNAAEIVEEARDALSARERAIQRGHGAWEPGVVVMNPSAQHRREQHREPLRAEEAARA